MLQIDTTSSIKALRKLKESTKEKIIIMYSFSLSLSLSLSKVTMYAMHKILIGKINFINEPEFFIWEELVNLHPPLVQKR